MRGRSEAQRLARCRAQMQHRCRDGQRRRRDARCDHLTTAASPRRMHEREPFVGDRTGHQTRSECDLFAGNIFRTNRTGSSGRSGSQPNTFAAAKHAALLADEHAVLDNLQRQRQSWRERPLRTCAGPRRARAAGSLTPWFPPLTATGTLDGGRQRAPPVSRALAPTTAKSLSTNGMRTAAKRAG